MEQFKRAKVIILPTKEISLITLDDKELFLNNVPKFNENPFGYKNQHLYIISDDEIKENDWWLNIDNNTISNTLILAEAANRAPSCKKIIATTDTSLKVKSDINNINSINFQLPQPSQQFITNYIKSYNKGEVITDVLVEGEDLIDETCGDVVFCPKIYSKDNTIIIKTVKNSWNREEHIKDIIDFATFYSGMERNKVEKQVDKWTEENF